MLTAVARKSISDLTRRKARTFFTVAHARARGRERRDLRGPGSLMQHAMEREVAAAASPTSRSRCSRCRSQRRPARRARSGCPTSRRSSRAAVRHARLGRRTAASGRSSSACATSPASAPTWSRSTPAGRRAPTPLLSDQANARQGLHAAHAVRLLTRRRRRTRCPISGVGRNLTGGEDDPTNDWITFYATTGHGRAAQRRPGLHVAGPAPARRPPRRSRAHRRSGARPAAGHDGLRRLRRPARVSSSPATTRARRTSRAWRACSTSSRCWRCSPRSC